MRLKLSEINENLTDEKWIIKFEKMREREKYLDLIYNNTKTTTQIWNEFKIRRRDISKELLFLKWFNKNIINMVWNQNFRPFYETDFMTQLSVLNNIKKQGFSGVEQISKVATIYYLKYLTTIAKKYNNLLNEKGIY